MQQVHFDVFGAHRALEITCPGTLRRPSVSSELSERLHRSAAAPRPAPPAPAQLMRHPCSTTGVTLRRTFSSVFASAERTRPRPVWPYPETLKTQFGWCRLRCAASLRHAELLCDGCGGFEILLAVEWEFEWTAYCRHHPSSMSWIRRARRRLHGWIQPSYGAEPLAGSPDVALAVMHWRIADWTPLQQPVATLPHSNAGLISSR